MLKPDMHTTVAHHRTSAATIGRVTSVLALAALLNASWRCLRDVHQRRMAERPHTKPEKLQVWEDEGGQNQMPGAPPQ